MSLHYHRIADNSGSLSRCHGWVAPCRVLHGRFPGDRRRGVFRYVILERGRLFCGRRSSLVHLNQVAWRTAHRDRGIATGIILNAGAPTHLVPVDLSDAVPEGPGVALVNFDGHSPAYAHAGDVTIVELVRRAPCEIDFAIVQFGKRSHMIPKVRRVRPSLMNFDERTRIVVIGVSISLR